MRDVVVYIHGLVPRDPFPHTDGYRAFHEGIRARGVALPEFDGPDVIETEFWWPAGGGLESAGLSTAQAAIGALMPTGRHRTDLLTAGLMRGVRELLQYTWSDAFFYAAPEGKRRTRTDLWTQILDAVPFDTDVDLTFVAHSGGTLVAVDFLFYLFSGERTDERTEFADRERWERAQAHWRIDRLVTMGSPLAPLVVRSVDLVDRFAADPEFRLDPASIGFDDQAHRGRAPRWLNVWDVHDIISFPVAGLYGDDTRIRDLYPDVGDWPGSVHGRYWSDTGVHRVLATHWD
jgi:hypothetical protein